MIAILAFALLQTVSLPGPGPFQTTPPVLPGFVSNNQGASTETTAVGTKTYNSCATDAYCTHVVDPSLAGNTLIVAVTYGHSTSSVPTISDDKSNGYTHCASEAHDSTNNRWVDIFYLVGATTGTRNITITWSTSVTNAQASVAQFWNVTGFDVCAANASGTATTTFQSGSITTTAANDLLYTFAVGTNPATNTGTFTAGSQSGITWNLLGPDQRDGSVAQFGVLGSAGSLNPQLTISSSSAYAAVSIALKAGSAGTAPTGMYLACMQSYNAANSSTGPYANQIACPAGNLLVAEMNGGYPQEPTGITDSNNTWIQCGSLVTQANSGDPVTGVWYVPNANLPNEALSYSTTGTGDTSMWFYSFAGASTKNFCGQQTVAATNPGWSAPTLTPFSGVSGAVSSGVSVISLGQYSNTVIAVTAPSNALFDSNTFGGMSLSGPEPVDENNLRGHGPAAPGLQTWSETETDSATAPYHVSAEVDSFPAPGAVFATYTSAEATGTATLAVSKTLVNSGDALIVAVGMYNGATGRNVTKICLDGTGCAGGNSFTQAPSAASLADSTEANTDIWYLLNAGSSGSKTITVTLSGSASNIEATVYEVAGISAFDVANHVNHNSSGGTSVTGASVTTTGSPEFVVACAGVSTSVIHNPTDGNEFAYGGVIYANTTDASNALLTNTTGAHQPEWYTSGYLNGSTAAFK